MIKIDRLGDRLDLLSRIDPALRTRAELAARLRVSPGTLAQMINGREDRGYDPGEVSRDALDKLVVLLVELKGKSISSDAARELWTGSYGLFSSVLAPRRRSLLEGVLERTAPTLEAAVEFEPDGMGLIEDQHAVPEEATVIRRRQQYALTVRGRAKGVLTILCRDARDWQFVSPSQHHSGHFDRASRYPEASEWLYFDDSKGRHDVFFIVHPPDLVSGLPRFVEYAEVVSKDDVNGLALALQAKLWSGRWAWGKITLFVVEAQSAVRPAREAAPAQRRMRSRKSAAPPTGRAR